MTLVLPVRRLGPEFGLFLPEMMIKYEIEMKFQQQNGHFGHEGCQEEPEADNCNQLSGNQWLRDTRKHSEGSFNTVKVHRAVQNRMKNE